MRYIRAFFIALWWTIRGKKVPIRHPLLLEWVNEGVKKLKKIQALAKQNGFDKTRRESIKIRVDGRDVSMDVVIAAVEHNLLREYPRLINFEDEHSLTVIYASNMNDQYRVMKLGEVPEIKSSSLDESLQALLTHLESIPPSNEV